MTGWLNRRTIWQYALILWLGAVLCILVVFAVLTWIGIGPFHLTLFVGLAVVLPLIGLPGPLWGHRQRLRAASRDMADDQN